MKNPSEERPLQLKSITEEAAGCRKAWAGQPAAVFAFHVHHRILCESITEPLENRITYIIAHKPENEQPLRLRLLRPVFGTLSAELKKACMLWTQADIDSWYEAPDTREAHQQQADIALQQVVEIAHKKQCKNCPWNGQTIFNGEAAP